ncbi:four helix bundle protein [bacterium]|nr:four helix bundle protein [bacterium]
MQFDHEKLDVYKAALEFNRLVAEFSGELKENNRHSRDQLIRAALSIPLNIAEGNGKRSPADRKRFFEIARGSAMECAGVLDVLVVTGGLEKDSVDGCKTVLVRVVSMLTRMTENTATVAREEEGEYQ